ncbi:MAG: Gfo/Idh/MocA family oxidoreductase [Anaerolineae bacterium]|nr:Gfo/Idh/MocA family oxidoreductase [Anaerolineae bacterium]
MADVLRWGLISTAKINDKLIQAMKGSKRHQLAAVASRNLDKSKVYAREKGINRAYGSYEELLADPDVDVVYNPLPNHLHAEWTIKAIQAGKHVLCEKPFVLTLEEMDAVEAAAREHGKVVQEAFMYRHHPQTLKVKEMLDQGVIGKVGMIRGVFTFLLEDPENVRLKPEWGGGSLWDVGVYPISYIRTMLGMEPEEVLCWQELGPTGVDVAFGGEMRFAGKLLAQFQSGFATTHYTSMEILGDKGSLQIPVPFGPGKSTSINLFLDRDPQKVDIKGMELYLGELDDMAECIWHGKTPRVTLDDTRRNTKVLLACLESANTGKAVRV